MDKRPDQYRRFDDSDDRCIRHSEPLQVNTFANDTALIDGRMLAVSIMPRLAPGRFRRMDYIIDLV